MSRKNVKKRYWEMNTEELREATEDLDVEFVADKAKEMSPALQSQWERAKGKSTESANGFGWLTITVHLEEVLLDQCTALAKKKRISRDALIARGLKALLAAEGEARSKPRTPISPAKRARP